MPLVHPVVVRATRSLAEALFSSESGPPPEDRLLWVEHNIEDFLARAGTRARWTFGFMVVLCSVVAPLFAGRLATLGSLPLPERIAALSRLERLFGEPLLAIKALLCMIYYEHPDAAREVGFDGVCLLGGHGHS